MSFPTSPIQPTSDISRTQAAQGAQNASRMAAAQEAMRDSFQTYVDEFSVNTMQIIRRNSENLDEKIKKKPRTESSEHSKETAEDETELELEVEATEQISEYLDNKNPDFAKKPLGSLKDQISKNDTAEDILQKVLDAYPDPISQEAALEYLLKVLPDEFKEKIYNAKTSFEKRFGRQLKAAKNVFQESVKFEKEGLAEAFELRQTYADLTQDTKSPLDLFEALLKRFTFEKMTGAIAFWLSALGADLNEKGSSIQKGELHKLIQEAKSLQAILGVYTHFASKQKELILSLARNDQKATPELNYQNLARLFVKLLQEKFPSPEKFLFVKYDLKIENQLLAQEAVLNIMFAGLKNVAPRLFRNQKHQDEVRDCILLALEAIDNILSEQNES